MNTAFVLKGDLCFSESLTNMKTIQDGYLVCENGKCLGCFDKLPETYASLPLRDYSGLLIFPGLVDLHIHAPQFSFRGTAMDLELIDWLNRYTFPEEAKFSDLAYAEKAYGYFADAMRRSATTRACIFGTRHREATVLLMEKMEQSGLVSYVGKINMDRESIPELQEKSALDSAFNTFGWINDVAGRFRRTFPILTPRFIPSCSDELMEELKEIQRAYDLPLQSHLSENPGEVEWVKELCPASLFYGDAYDRWGLFGGEVKTVMAHCIYSTEEEIELMRRRGVFVAHCPTSNMNLSSGIAPIRKYLELGIPVGLGSDVAGGDTESMFRAITDTVMASKMYWRIVDESKKPLKFAEAFALATIGGGAFFGKVGSFKPGYDFDAVVLDDRSVPCPYEQTVEERMERAAYLAMDLTGIRAKFVCGEEVQL